MQIAQDPFRSVLGDRRGSGRADVLGPDLPARQIILDVLKNLVRYETVQLTVSPTLRYVALARGEHNGHLYIVGGGQSIPDVLAVFVLAQANDFAPEWVVDLDEPDIRQCVLSTYYEKDSFAGPGVLRVATKPAGIADLR